MPQIATICGMRSLGNLRRARIRIHRQLDKLEPMLAAYHFKLAHVEAQIQALALELPLPMRHRTYQPNPYFMRGGTADIFFASLFLSERLGIRLGSDRRRSYFILVCLFLP
jgi:hypothetical protein